MRPLAQYLREPISLLEAHTALGSTLIHLGDFRAAREHFDAAMLLYDPEPCRVLAFSRGTNPAIVCLIRRAWTLWCLGYADQALAESHKALDLARESGHDSSVAFAIFFTAVIYQCRREERHVREYAEWLFNFSSEHQFSQWIAGGQLLRGWALIHQGSVEEGIQELQNGHRQWLEAGNELGKTQICARVAEAYGQAGRPEEGLQMLAESFAALEKNGECHYESELYRLKGELLLQAASSEIATPAEAETHLRRAIAIAQRQQAKFQELRAVVSLCRLWQTQGKHAEARSLLALTYHGFTEGFDTPDLRSARALLDTLSQ